MSFARAWIPNQHGAWAMLVAPVLVGALAAGVNAWHLLLLATWLSAFCLNFFVSLSIKSRRPRRYRQQLLIYAGLVSAMGLLVAWHTPQVLLMLGAALPAFAVNLLFVLRRNERAWLNDVVGIALAGVVGYGAYGIGNHPVDNAHAVHAVLAVCLYFVGTVIYVKTLIRERGRRAWLRLSYGYHAALVLACIVAGWPVPVLVTAMLLLRAVAVPGRGWSPKRVGLTEIGSTLAVALAALITLP